MRRVERKLQLSHTVVGDDAMDEDQKETMGVEMGDLQSVIFGLHKFDLKEINNEESNSTNLSKLISMVEKVIAIRHKQILDEAGRKFEVDPNILDRSDLVMQGGSAFKGFDSGLDEASYLAWVEKFKETSQSSGDSILEMGNRKRLPEDKHFKLKAARKNTEEKNLAKWEAHGYHSLSVKDPIGLVDGDMMSDSGYVHLVYGDCTHPSKLCG